MSTTAAKSGPIPTRFREGEELFLKAAHDATGVPVVELVRRGVRLMRRQQQLLNNYGFILELSEQKP